MQTTRAAGGPSDRTLTRIIRALALLLLIGVPLIVFIYWSDRHVDAGPSLADRQITAAADAVRADPNNAAKRDRLAAAYVSAGRYDEGIAQFGEVLKLDAKNRPALLGRGIAYLAATKLDLAKADFQALVDQSKGGEMAGTDPQLEQAYYELGVIALQQKRPTAAADVLAKALAIDGSDADALNSYGAALIQTGDATKGIAALRRAVAFVPSGWCDPYRTMVDGYTSLGSADGVAYANAMVSFCGGELDAAAAGLKPLTDGALRIDALLGLALVSAAEGDAAAATTYYNQVLALDPKNASAGIGLAQIGGAGAHAGMPGASTAPAGSN
jgi:tetratricopeptide (TPR) repeat protein